MRLSCCYNRVFIVCPLIVSTISLTVTEKSECALDKHGSPIPSLKLKKTPDYWFRKKDFNQYRKCRNMYNSMIKNAKENYFNNANKTNEHPTTLWRNLKSLVSGTSTHKLLPSSMIFNEKQVNTKQNIVDSLNKHVVNISLYSDVNSVDDSQLLPLKIYVNSKLHPSTQFVVKEITPFDVMKIVKSIKNTKSVGLDDISSRVLKLATDVLSIPLASIINNSIKQNIFPEELKHAKVYIKSM